MTTRKLFVRWFVQYNPLFTASALCMLAGVLLASRVLGSVLSTVVLELYQATLIGLAAFLYRRMRERRPAAILGIIALVFLVDPTLQMSALAASSHEALTIVWVALFAAKWTGLQHAFRLRMSPSARWLPPIAAAFVAFLPTMRVLDLVDPLQQPFVIATVAFAIGALAVLSPMRISVRDVVDDTMFVRIKNAAIVIGALGTAYQMWNALFATGPAAVAPIVLAALLVVVVAAKRELAVWIAAALAMMLATQGPTPFREEAAMLVGVALALAARRHEPRVLVAALVCASIATHNATAAIVVVTIGCAVLLWHKRAWSALPALAFVHLTTITHAAHNVPRSTTLWAAVLVVAAFALLPIGAFLHRRLSKTIDADSTLSTSAAAISNATTS